MSRRMRTLGDGQRAFERWGSWKSDMWRVATLPHCSIFRRFGFCRFATVGTTAFGGHWIEQLLARHNAEGFDALGDSRRRNGASAKLLKPELLVKFRDRLRELPPDGGV
jgi:hypothetical protein